MSKYLYPSLATGLIVGFIITLLNLFLVQPLIIEAELLEQHSINVAHVHLQTNDGGSTFINERNFLTLLVNIAMTSAFSLMVVGCYYAREGINDSRSLLKITFSGFIIFFLLPKIFILPQLPGQSLGNTTTAQLTWILVTLGSIIILIIIDALRYYSEKFLLFLSISIIFIFVLLNADIVIYKTDPLHLSFIYYTFVSNLILWVMLYFNLEYFIKD